MEVPSLLLREASGKKKVFRLAIEMKTGKFGIPLFLIAFHVCMACVFFIFPAPSFSAFSSADKGTSSGQFLKLGAGARATGMGEAYSAVVDDATAIYWNPAALVRIKGFSATFMHTAFVADILYEFFGYGQKLGDVGFLGVGIQYLSMPALPETDSFGIETGTIFNPKDMAVSLAYSYPLNILGLGDSVGISGKYIRSEIVNSASTLTVDLGVLVTPCYASRVTPCHVSGRDLKFSFVVQNLGGSLKFDQESEPLPFNMKLGGALPIMRNWLAGLDVNFPRDNQPYMTLGAEYRLNYGSDLGFAGRAGFNSRTFGDLDGLRGLSLGAGISFKESRLDYAFLPVGSIGVAHNISITFGFAKPESSRSANFYRNYPK